MDPQFNDALILIGLKEMELAYLRKQIAELQTALKKALEQSKDAPNPEVN